MIVAAFNVELGRRVVMEFALAETILRAAVEVPRNVDLGKNALFLLACARPADTALIRRLSDTG